MKRLIPRSVQLLLFILIFVSLACNLSAPALPSVFSTPTATPQPLPPAITETVPSMGSELPLRAPLTIYFSEPMQRSSVESGLSADPATKLDFQWVDDSTLTVTPSQPFPTNATVTFTLDTNARAANGLALLQATSFHFQTTGPLQVTQVLPDDGAEQVSPDTAVVVAFNQPVVALGADPASLPAGLTLQPSAQGEGEWINTSTYVFHPGPALDGGANYAAQVNPQLVGASGAALDTTSQGLTWHFSTALPQVSDVQPQAGQIGPDATFQVTFNQPMDRASVQSHFSLSIPNGPVSGKFTWDEKGTVLTFQPDALLPRNQSVNLTIGQAAQSVNGASLTADSQTDYTTFADFGVASTAPQNGQTKNYNDTPTITLTAPLSQATANQIDSYVTVSPDVPNLIVSSDQKAVYIYGSYNPNQMYTVTLSGKLADQWDEPLGQNFSFSFQQGPAKPALDFSSVFQTVFVRPDSPLIDVQYTNLNSLNVVRGTMSQSDFFRFGTDYKFSQTYQPADLQSWTEYPTADQNQSQVYGVDLSHGAQSLPTGFYYADVSSDQVQKVPYTARPVVVSNINVTFKLSATQALVWAMDLRDMSPAADAPVTIYDSSGQFVSNGTTDANGLWQGNIPNQGDYVGAYYAILGQPGDDLFGVSMSSWNLGVQPFDFDIQNDYNGPGPNVYLYSDRPVYQPGQTVYFRGIVRQAYDGRYQPLKLQNVQLEVIDVDGHQVTHFTDLISAYGTFHGQFQLPDAAKPGAYTLHVLPDKSIGLSDQYLSFQVADYRKPEINLSVDVSPNPALSDTSLTGSVHADYFFGAPVNNLSVQWTLYQQNSSFSIPDFTTGLVGSDALVGPPASFGGLGSIVTSGSGVTDSSGTLTIPLTGVKVDDTMQLTLEVTATESSGFPVSARSSVTVHPARFYVGLRPNAWVGQAGTPLGVTLQTVDWDGKPVGNLPLTVAFEKVTWERKASRYGFPVYVPSFTPVDSQDVTLNANGQATASFTPSEAGTFVFDASGQGAHTQVMVWVGGSENAVWPNLPYQQIKLTADKNDYKPGDTAEVFIPNPFGSDVPALITTERSTFLSAQVVSIPAGGSKVNFSLSDENAPNTYVSVTLLGPQNDFRQGYVNLTVDPSKFVLNVALKATPQNAKPGDKLSLDLTVTDSKRQPVQAEFSMSVVDLAVLALADPNAPDIVPAYYAVQPLGVQTGLSEAVYGQRLLQLPGGLGGGGGGGALTVRSKFPDTAYWRADIVTDAQGKAQVSFTLPDNLTTWQVDARGVTQNTRVGQARVQVVTSKDLLIRPQTPAFLVVGDHVELAAMVNNNTAQAVQATVNLQATGFTLDDAKTAQQTVSVPAHDRARVNWWGSVQDAVSVDATFSVTAGNLQDASKPQDGPIPVLHYSAPQTFSTAGVLTGAATRQEIISLPRTFVPLGGQLDVQLFPSLASTILDSLDSLDIPDQVWSNEQVVSSFLPSLATYQTLQKVGAQNQDLSGRVTQNVNEGILRLESDQNADGGWGWTVGGQSDPYVSTYVLWGLSQAQAAGFDTDSDIIQKAHDYLLAVPLNDQSESTANGAAMPKWRANLQTFILFVAQNAGGIDPNTIDLVYQQQNDLEPWAKALLADVIAQNDHSDTRANDLLSSLQTNAIRSATGAHWESSQDSWRVPGSPLFTTAVVVYTLAGRDPANPLLVDAVRYLAANRSASGEWGSSYETAWVLIALNQYMKASGELQGDFQFGAALNGAPLAQGQASGPQNLTSVNANVPLTQINLRDPNALIITRLDGPGKLYYRAALTVDRPVEDAPALDQGLSVSREFLDCQGTACKPVTSWQMQPDQSGRIKVQLTVTVPHDAYYLMVQDHIPAGADILDSSLNTSQQGQASTSVQPQYDPTNPFSQGWGWWYFNQPSVYSDHILWSADYVPAGTYVLTYTLIPSVPGDYRVLPAHAWQAFFPEVQGTSAGASFEIKPVP